MAIQPLSHTIIDKTVTYLYLSGEVTGEPTSSGCCRENSYGAPAEKHPPQLQYWTVRSSRKSTGVIALSRTRFAASNTAACLSLSPLSGSTWRIVNISRNNLRNNWEFRGVDGTWTSIDVRAQTARTIVCTGCLAFVILRSLAASFSRTCFRSFVLSPTARASTHLARTRANFPCKHRNHKLDEENSSMLYKKLINMWDEENKL